MKDLIYQCLTCSHLEIVKASDPRKDGRQCSDCGKYTTPIGFVDINVANDDFQGRRIIKVPRG